MNEETKRLSPLKDTLNRLFAFSGNECAFPGCTSKLIDDEDNFIGQVCHIEAAMKGGQRFNKAQNNEDRRKFENLLLMCYPHHIKTDNVTKYPIEALKQIKENHEKRFRSAEAQYHIDDQVVTTIYNDLLNSIKEDTTAIRQDTGEIKETMSDVLDALRQLSSDRDAKVKSDFNDRIDEILAFRNKNQQRVALELFGKLWQKSEADMSDKEKYRVFANMGICHLELFENEAASTYFILAETYQPDNIRAITYAALGYALVKNIVRAEEYIEKALNIEPNNTDAYSTMVILFKKELPFPELLQKIPEAIRQNPQVAFALSMAARELDNFHEAINWANVALENSEGDQVDLKANLGALILESIHNPFTIASSQSNQDTINKAKYIVQLYDESWAAIKDSDLKNSRGWWLLNRGAAKRIIGDREGAYEDMATACSHDASFHNYRQLALMAVEKNNLDKAWEIAEQLIGMAGDAPQRQDILLFKAEIKAIKKEYAEADAIIQALFGEDMDEKTESHVMELQLKIMIHTERIDVAEKLTELMISNHPNRIMPYVFRARIKRSRPEPAPVTDDLEKALANVSDSSLFEDMRQLAMEFRIEKSYARAVELMEKVTDVTVLSPVSEDLLKLYYEAGETKKLLNLCNRLIATYGPKHILTEHQVVTYQHLNDIPNAIKSCMDYLAIYPDDQRVISRLLLIYYKANDHENLKAYCSRIDKVDAQLPYNIQYKIALFFFLTGEKEKCYDAAYETRKQYFNTKHSHELFVGLLMGIGPQIEHPSDPTVAGLNAAVTVALEGKLHTYVISSDQSKDLLVDEIAESNPIAQKLLGKSPGDEVVFGNRYEDEAYRVTAILHRYNYAYIESMRLLDEHFLENKSFKKFKIGDTGNVQEDFKPLFDQLNKAVKQNEYLNNFMATGFATVGSLSTFKLINPVKVWGDLLPFNSPGIKTTNGFNEFRIAHEKLNEGKGILFDVISLMTIGLLGLADLIDTLPNAKAVSQSTLDHINELIRDDQFFADGSSTFLPFEGTFILHEEPAEQIANRKNLLQTLHQWIIDKFEVLPCNEAKNMLLQDKQYLDNLIGESFAESLLTAKEKGYLIYAEEWNVRALGHTEYGLDGVYSFALFGYLSDRRVITAEKYQELVISLISLNYKMLPTDSAVIMRCFEIYKDVKHRFFFAR